MKHRRPYRDRGFTLVEVLVALVIVAVGMAAVLGALSSAAEGISYFREKTFAQWVALNRIAEVRLQRTRPSEGKSKGDSELAGRKWRWEQEVTELDIPGVMRIDVKVQPAETPQRDSWTATSTGIVGEAIAPPGTANPNFDSVPPGPPGSGTGDGTEEPPPPPTTDDNVEPPPPPPDDTET